jgi:fumarate reductase subunit C
VGEEEVSARSDPTPVLRRPMSRAWFLKRPSWFLFLLREATAVFVGVFALEVLLMVRAVGQGPEAYAAFLDRLACPGTVAFHAVALLFVLYHTVTWFVAAPKAMRLKVGEEPVPPAAIVAGHYLAWAAVSAAVLWLFLGGW